MSDKIIFVIHTVNSKLRRANVVTLLCKPELSSTDFAELLLSLFLIFDNKKVNIFFKAI